MFAPKPNHNLKLSNEKETFGSFILSYFCLKKKKILMGTVQIFPHNQNCQIFLSFLSL